MAHWVTEHIFNPGMQEAEIGRLLWVQGQFGLCSTSKPARTTNWDPVSKKYSSVVLDISFDRDMISVLSQCPFIKQQAF